MTDPGTVAVPLRAVGLLGELRIPQQEQGMLPEPLVRAKLISATDAGWWVTRGARYYQQLDLHTALREGAELLADLRAVRCSRHGCAALAAYVLADHAMNRYIRVAFTLAGLLDRDDWWWPEVLSPIQACATTLARILQGDHAVPEITSPPEDPGSLPNAPIRTLVDGDNHVMTMVTLGETHRPVEPVVGLLLGAGAAAPIAAAVWRVPWAYLLFSLYDAPQRQEPMLIEGPGTLPAGPRLLLDDNCGTGRTLASASDFLAARTGQRVRRLTVELHWEKLLRVRGFRHFDEVFDVRDLAAYPPWCYRHHHLIRRLVSDTVGGTTVRISVADWALYSLSNLLILRDCVFADPCERAAVDAALDSALRLAPGHGPGPEAETPVLTGFLQRCTRSGSSQLIH